MKVFRMATVATTLLASQWAFAAAPSGDGYYNAASNMTSTSLVGDGGCCPAACEPACCDPCAPCCDTGCDTCFLMGPSDPLHLLSDECRGINIGGWTQWGYHDNAGLPIARWNNRPNEFANHQSWLYAEKIADGSGGLGIGGRADILYGLDAQDTQAFGGQPTNWDNQWDHGQYGWALPQLYAEVAVGDLSVKAGKFFTPIGYEVIAAPDNFFYSHAFTQYNSEPFTHTGVLGSYGMSDAVTVYSGWTLGWDSGFDSAANDGSAYLGGLGIGLTDNISATWMCTAGKFGGFAGATRGDGYMQSFVVDVTLLDNLNYIFQSDYLDNDIGEEDYGVNQYLIYWLNDCVGAGTRMEWWRDGTAGGGNISHYEWTNGLNVRPMANLNFRPEIRYEWSPGLNRDEWIGAIDTYFVF